MITTTTKIPNLFKSHLSLFKGIFILIFLFAQLNSYGQTATDGDYRTRATGAWSGASTWQVRASATWSNTSTPPTSTANIYIQNGHTLTLDVTTGSCNNLQLHTGGVMAIGTNTLQVNGKIRAYTGTAVTTTGADGAFYTGQTSSISPGAGNITSSGAGKLSVVGNSRTLFTTGEWAGTTTGFSIEINLNSGQTATATAGAKAANWTINSGTLNVGANTIGVDNGTTGGNFTIANGAVFVSARTSAGNCVMQRTGTTLGGTLTVNGTLQLTGASPSIAMTTVTLNGTVNYSNAGTQTLWTTPSGSSQGSAAPLNTFTNLTLSGTSAKTLGVNTTVNGTLSMQGTASLAYGAFSFTYGATSTLEYNGSTTQTAASTEFPSSGGPLNLIVNNSNGFRLPFSRTIGGDVTISAGDVQNLSGTGATLTMSGAAATLSVAGSITGTNVGAGNDLNLSITGTQTTVSGAGSLVRFLSATVGSSSKLILTRGLQLMFNVTNAINGILQINGGGFVDLQSGALLTYGASSTLIYNTTSYTTTTSEFPNTGVKNVTITAPSGTNTVTLDADKTITGTLIVGNHTLNGGKSMNAATITIGTGSMVMGTLTTSSAFTCSGASSISLTGSWNVVGFTKSTSTVSFTGTGNVNNATSFYNLTNSAGTRSLTQNIDVENALLVSGGQIGVTGASGKSLTMSGSSATITITAGAIYGTDAGAGNDLSLIVSGTLTTLSGNATASLDDEKKFFNVTVNSGSTLALSRGILCKYGTFTANGTIQINANGYVQNDVSYGANAKLPAYNSSTGALIYNNGGSYTSAGEWPSTSSPSNVTIQNSSGVILSGSRSIAGTLTLTAGTIELGSNNLTIDAAGTISVSSPSTTKMIIASGAGQLRKTFTGTGSFLYPVGDNVSTVEYSPITLNFTAGSFSSAYAGVNLSNSKQGSNASATDYINRFWTISASGIASPTYTATAEYADGDIAGTEANLYGGLYAASTWNCMGPVTTASNTISSSLTQFGDITAGDVASMGCCINPSAGGSIDAAQTICSGGDPAAFTSISLPTGHTGTLEYQWQSSTTSAVAGFSDIFGANSTTYDIPSGLTTTSWYKRLSRVTCKTTWVGAASSNVLEITVTQPPTTSAAGSDQNGSGTCGLTTVTLAANAPSIGTGAWSIVSGAGGSFSNASSESSDFSGTAGTTYTLRWTISNSPCSASTDDVDVTFNLNPTTSNAGSAISICSIGVANLAANSPTNGTGLWSITSGPSSNLSQFSNTASPTSTFTPDGGTGSYVLTWTISNSPCTASSSNVTVTVVSGTTGEWIGGISTDWSDVNNWCGSVPTSSTDVNIPNGTTYYPIITSGTQVAKSISIASAASLQVNGGSLTLASSGDVANAGALTVGPSGTLNMVNNLVSGTGTVTVNGTLSTQNSVGLSGGASTTIVNTVSSLTLGSASTIDYASVGPQDITATNYANLSNSGNGDRTLANSGTIGISATFTPGSGAYIASGSTLEFNGTAAQSIPAILPDSKYDNLTINNSAGVSMSADLAIEGALTLTSGTFTTTGYDFTLLSTSSKTARIAPVTGGTITGDIIMQRFVPGGVAGWATICAPVSGATLAQWNDDIATSGFTGSTYGPGIFNSIYTYDETIPGLSSVSNAYIQATNVTNSIDPTKGYYVFIDMASPTVADKLLDVKGPPLVGSQDLNVTFTSSGGVDEDGWNLVANPYASAINWNAGAWTKTNMDNSFYIYEANSAQYKGISGGVSYNGGGATIASSQAFLVHANAASPSLIADENIKVASNPTFYKESNVGTGILRLQLDGLNGTYFDETVFHTDINATSNFDPAFDGYKLYSFDPAAPNISSKLNGIEYVVNTVGDLNTNLDLPVRVNVNTPGSYTINFIGLQEFANVTCFSLEDKLTNTWVDLHIDSTYTFSSAIDTVKSYARFVLHFGVESIVPQISPSATTVSIPGSTSVDFTNLTTGANSYSWDFGDGSPVENTVSPSHTYSAVGVYTVTLTAGNTAGCSQTSTVLITVDDVTGINTVAAEESILIGKDAQGVYANYNFKNSTLVKLSIYNALGEQIGLTKNKTVQSKGQFYVETSGLAKGIYTVELLVNNKKITRKVML